MIEMKPYSKEFGEQHIAFAKKILDKKVAFEFVLPSSLL